MSQVKKLNVLVYGATGSQSSPVVHHLLARGHQPYVFTRHPEKAAELEAAGARIVVGDLADSEAIKAASQGMDAVSLLIPFSMGNAHPAVVGKTIIDAAKAAGVSLIVWNTSGFIPPVRTGNPAYDARIDIADYLWESDVPHVTFIPTVYLENLLGPYTAPFVANENRLAYPTPPDMRINWLASDDLGALTVAALEQPGLANSVFAVGGQALLTGPELADQFSKALGRPITYYPMPPAEFGRLLTGAIGPEAATAVAQGYQNMWDFPERRPDFSVDTEPLLAKLPVRMTSIQEWVAKYSSAFNPTN